MSGFMSLRLLDENNNTNDDICYYPVENLVEKDFNTLKLNAKIHVFTRGTSQNKKLFQLMSTELLKSKV